MLSQSETLIIGFDAADGRDISCLTVLRWADTKLLVANTFYGKEAEEMYKHLTVHYGRQRNG